MPSSVILSHCSIRSQALFSTPLPMLCCVGTHLVQKRQEGPRVTCTVQTDVEWACLSVAHPGASLGPAPAELSTVARSKGMSSSCDSHSSSVHCACHRPSARGALPRLHAVVALCIVIRQQDLLQSSLNGELLSMLHFQERSIKASASPGRPCRMPLAHLRVAAQEERQDGLQVSHLAGEGLHHRLVPPANTIKLRQRTSNGSFSKLTFILQQRR